jgi:hypothetical protein
MEVAASQTSPLRAVAWRYSSHTDAYIAVQNTSTTQLSVSTSVVTQGREREIREAHLNPGEFDAAKLPSTDELGDADQARPAGVVVRHDGDPGAVVAQGWLLDDEIGFSAPFGFRGGMGQMSSKNPVDHIFRAGVMIGNADPSMGFPAGVVFSPRLALWNPSAEPVVAKPLFSYTQNSRVRTATLPQISLPAAGSVLLNLRDYQLRGLIPADVAQGNIRLDYSAAHEGLLADLVSVDQSGSFVSPVPLTCAGNRSMHMVFWRTDGAWESMLTLHNVATTSNDLEVRITWQGGSYLVRETIAPSDSAMVSINMLQSSQEPDEEGHVIPREAVLGGINILSNNVDNGLIVNGMFMNPETRTCGGCNGQPYLTNWCLTEKHTTNLTPFYCGFDPHLPGDFFTLYLSARYSNGDQFPAPVGGDGTSNSSVAALNGVGGIQVVGGGNAVINAVSANTYATDPNCTSQTTVSASDSLLAQVPSKLVYADFPPRAPNGIGPVITITDGDVVDTAGNIILSNRCGVYRDLAYQLVDQQTAPQPIVVAYHIDETFTDYSGSGQVPTPFNADISAGGLVGDLQYFGTPAPNCPGPNDHDVFKQHFSVTINGQNYNLSTVVSISRGMFSGTYRCDVSITTP